MKTLFLFSILLFNILITFCQDTLYWKDGKVSLCELKELNLKYDKLGATDFGKKVVYSIPLKDLTEVGGSNKNKKLADKINSRIVFLLIGSGGQLNRGSKAKKPGD